MAEYVVEISNLEATNSQATWTRGFDTAGTAVDHGRATSAVDTTANKALDLNCTNGGGSEFTVHGWRIEIVK